MIVTSKELYKIAQEKNFAIPAANYIDALSAAAHIEVAEKLNLPLILEFAEAHETLLPFEDGLEIGKYYAEKAKVPVVLHLDHGTTKEKIFQAIDFGFRSVMIDASSYSFEENVKRTKEIVDYAHLRGVVVEAEIGHVGEGEEYDDQENNNNIYTTAAEAKAFVEAVVSKLPSADLVEAGIAAPAVDLTAVLAAAKGSNLKVAAQNTYFENAGAFTGETSPQVLKEIGTDYVVIGHSERRDYFHETDEDINKKAKAIFANGMLPIICCGESLETYEAGKAAEFVGAQVSAALAGLTAEQVASTVIAYEPIWAIGTGKSASQDDAQKMCKVVRDVVAADFGQEVADKVRVQYGGSVKPENVAEYMACPDVDGALVGGASLEAESFLALLDFVK